MELFKHHHEQMKRRVPAQRLSFLGKRCLHFSLLLLLALILILALSHMVYAQFPLPEGLNQRNPVERPRTVTRYSNFETAPVTSPLDGKTLFTIASLTLENGSANSSEPSQPVETRAKGVQDRP